MTIIAAVGLVMIGIGVVFGIATTREFRRTGGRWTVGGRNYRRTAIVFGCVGLTLVVFGNSDGR